MTVSVVHRRNYNVLRPPDTHFRPATCEEVGCPDYLRGWRVRLARTDAERLEILRRCGRKYVETTAMDDAEREFIFEAGQPCFQVSKHRVPEGRPAIHVIRNGNSDPRRVSAQGWHDDLGEHLDRIREAQERG